MVKYNRRNITGGNNSIYYVGRFSLTNLRYRIWPSKILKKAWRQLKDRSSVREIVTFVLSIRGAAFIKLFILWSRFPKSGRGQRKTDTNCPLLLNINIFNFTNNRGAKHFSVTFGCLLLPKCCSMFKFKKN